MVTLGVALTQRDTFQRDRRTPRCQWPGCRRPAGAHLLPGIWTGIQALRLVRPGTEGPGRHAFCGCSADVGSRAGRGARRRAHWRTEVIAGTWGKLLAVNGRSTSADARETERRPLST